MDLFLIKDSSNTSLNTKVVLVAAAGFAVIFGKSLVIKLFLNYSPFNKMKMISKILKNNNKYTNQQVYTIKEIHVLSILFFKHLHH